MKKIIWGIIVIVIVFATWYAYYSSHIYDKGYKWDSITTDMANWKTYTNSDSGFEFKYPGNWQVETAENLSVRVINPNRIGKDDTDQPTEAVSIGFAQAPCKEMSWEVGFALVNYKTVCKSGVNIHAVAFDDMAKNIEDQIISTFKFIQASSGKERSLISTGKEVLLALKNKDYIKLETLTSKDGISLNEYPHELDLTKSDVTRNSVSDIPSDSAIRMWGYTDGKGDEIKLTTFDYINKWIYSKDYLNAPIIVVNKKANPDGNTPNNIDIFSNGRNYVGFHFSSSPQYPGMDYSTIYLIFDDENNIYKVRGIIKDQWTI